MPNASFPNLAFASAGRANASCTRANSSGVASSAAATPIKHYPSQRHVVSTVQQPHTPGGHRHSHRRPVEEVRVDQQCQRPHRDQVPRAACLPPPRAEWRSPSPGTPAAGCSAARTGTTPGTRDVAEASVSRAARRRAAAAGCRPPSRSRRSPGREIGSTAAAMRTSPVSSSASAYSSSIAASASSVVTTASDENGLPVTRPNSPIPSSHGTPAASPRPCGAGCSTKRSSRCRRTRRGSPAKTAPGRSRCRRRAHGLDLDARAVRRRRREEVPAGPGERGREHYRHREARASAVARTRPPRPADPPRKRRLALSRSLDCSSVSACYRCAPRAGIEMRQDAPARPDFARVRQIRTLKGRVCDGSREGGGINAPRLPRGVAPAPRGSRRP